MKEKVTDEDVGVMYLDGSTLVNQNAFPKSESKIRRLTTIEDTSTMQNLNKDFCEEFMNYKPRIRLPKPGRV